jgi:hypothetical protein
MWGTAIFGTPVSNPLPTDDTVMGSTDINIPIYLPEEVSTPNKALDRVFFVQLV